MGWLGRSGRCSRQLYWVMVGVLFAVAIVASIIHVDTSIGSVFWLTLYGRRLHDFGRSRWWAVAVLMLSAIPIVLLAALGGASFRYVLLHNGIDDAGHPSLAYFGVIGIAFLIQHSFTGWLGVQKGDEGANRFGNPPKSWGATSQGPIGVEPTIWEAKLWEDEEPSPPLTASAASSRSPSSMGAQLGGKGRPVFGRRPSA